MDSEQTNLAARIGRGAGGKQHGCAAPEYQAVLQSLLGDIADLGAQTTGQIVAVFLDNLPRAVGAILEGASQVQRKHAHKLKGVAANFRLDTLCVVLTRIEAIERGVDTDLCRLLNKTAQDAKTILDKAVREPGLQTDLGSTK